MYITILLEFLQVNNFFSMPLASFVSIHVFRKTLLRNERELSKTDLEIGPLIPFFSAANRFDTGTVNFRNK